MKKSIGAILLCAVVMSGCGAMPWQVTARVNDASAKWTKCFNSEVASAASRYSDVDLALEHASLTCAKQKAEYRLAFSKIGYTREQDEKETMRMETFLFRTARLRLLKHNADIDKALAADPVPMEMK